MPPCGAALFELLGDVVADTVLVMVSCIVVVMIEAAMFAFGAWNGRYTTQCAIEQQQTTTEKCRKNGRQRFRISHTTAVFMLESGELVWLEGSKLVVCASRVNYGQRDPLWKSPSKKLSLCR
jgi:hypothetical protein